MFFSAAYPKVEQRHEQRDGKHYLSVTGEMNGFDGVWRKVAHKVVYDETGLKAISFSDQQRLNWDSGTKGESFTVGDLDLLAVEERHPKKSFPIEKTYFGFIGEEIMAVEIRPEVPQEQGSKYFGAMLKSLLEGAVPVFSQ